MTRFNGKVALITGAASGIGRSTCVRLASEGASIFGVDINSEGLAETESIIKEGGRNDSGADRRRDRARRIASKLSTPPSRHLASSTYWPTWRASFVLLRRPTSPKKTGA